MTALSGLCWFGDDEQRMRLLARMQAAQSSYGPDGQASFGDGNVALGRALSRHLPEDHYDLGPVASADGRRALIADIRIDNRNELADALGLDPSVVKVTSDTGLLLRALEKWSEAALARIHGDFAFALWDGKAQSLLLARDYLGQRPLHFHRGQGWVALASMPKGLHALPCVPYAPRPAALAEFMALLPEHGTNTFFEGVERVPPGHLLRINRGGLELKRWWQPERRELRLADPREYAEGMAEQLDRAVKARLRGVSGAVGAHLSGGLDSSSVAATAARLLDPGRVVAFTAVPSFETPVGQERFGNEWSHAAAVAAMYPNIDHVPIRTGGASPLANLDRFFHLYERPVRNLCNGTWTTAIESDAQKRGLKILLSGQMGNYSISYGGLGGLAELVRGGNLLELTRTVRALRRGGARYGSIGSAAFGPFLPAGLWKAVNRATGRRVGMADHPALKPSAHDAFQLDDLASQRGFDPTYRPRADTFATRVWALQRVDLGPYNKGTLGGWGVDLRDPTADRRLVEYCLSIPSSEYLRGGQTRALARHAFRDRLPDAVCDERRKGLQAADWHVGLGQALGEVSEELDRLERLGIAADIIDSASLKRTVAEWPDSGWSDPQVIKRYRHGMLRAISAGHFLRKASGANM